MRQRQHNKTNKTAVSDSEQRKRTYGAGSLAKCGRGKGHTTAKINPKQTSKQKLPRATMSQERELGAKEPGSVHGEVWKRQGKQNKQKTPNKQQQQQQQKLQ